MTRSPVVQPTLAVLTLSPRQTREVLDKMAGNARARFHERRERLSEQIESRERALCRISAGKAAKQKEMLQLVRSRHESALQASERRLLREKRVARPLVASRCRWL